MRQSIIPLILTLGWCRQKDEEFKATLKYLVSSKAAWAA